MISESVRLSRDEEGTGRRESANSEGIENFRVSPLVVELVVLVPAMADKMDVLVC